MALVSILVNLSVLASAPIHQLDVARHFGIQDHQAVASTLFKDGPHLMPIAP